MIEEAFSKKSLVLYLPYYAFVSNEVYLFFVSDV